MRAKQKKTVEYSVFKRLDSFWDLWDGPFTSERRARAYMREFYEGAEFAVFKVTSERLPAPKGGHDV